MGGIRLVGLALALLLAALASPAAADAEAGRRLYEEGLLPSGAPLLATGVGGLRLEGRQAACINCHRRSGRGGAEGRILVPPVTGNALFAPRPSEGHALRRAHSAVTLLPSRHEARHPYDEATLARALTGGVDSSDRALDAVMPRYELDDEALVALTAHLRRLGATPMPGVEPSALHLATVVTPDASPEITEPLLEIVQGFGSQRADGARPWKVHVWRLEGSPERWTSQLEAFYRRQPVFAILSGAGAANWEPVHGFCERKRLPCILPLVEQPPQDAEHTYSLYFSAGLGLEARILGRHLVAAGAPAPWQIISGTAGQLAADILAGEIGGGKVRRLDMGALPADDETVVLWLRVAELEQALADLDQRGYGGKLFASALLAPPEQVRVPPRLRQRLHFVSAFNEPSRRRALETVGLLPWLERAGISSSGKRGQSEAFAACYFFADALALMRGELDRDYLLETLEQSLGDRPAGAPYPRLSLGPGQRYAAKGGTILRYADMTSSRMAPIGPLIVP